ncbi:ATP-binding cassette domain-containing protein [Chitinophaga oryziterrae]|uniref:Multidrug resistance-like ATP-binding protein MdlB n=1 Tax=Chitinophaga oryziterrae TaxID=1031224 RepID=A0A6N8JAM4_9BACT|nr:ABC transporter ATP-binding protein [Chitinophaga oryziterrae]MVT42280.1 ATP-binding cassette domain-containing protein [Chitinophaga oryziterrae]
MNYNLNKIAAAPQQKATTGRALRKLLSFLGPEKRRLINAFFTIMISSGINLTIPFLVGHTIDKYVQTKQYNGILLYSGILFIMFLISLTTSYVQTRLMGGVGQRMLYSLRNAVFTKLQELPIAFFNQNKTGDLISRINNDTDKLNQFFSQSLMQFIGGIVSMVGAGIFLLCINLRLGLATLAPGLLLLVFTRLISPWVKRKNAANMKSTGSMSSEIQESLSNFKVIIAFNRRDYFRKRFATANKEQYKTAVSAGLVNNIFMPVFSLCANLAQLSVLAYGIYLISTGQFTIGLLISYLSYATYFYNPIRQLAALWTNFQVAMAGWDRISQILNLESNLKVVPSDKKEEDTALITFKNVNFSYPDGKDILHNINFRLEKGKTYALVGPTGGGKTTTASLIARLYDATDGEVLLQGKDIRSYSPEERTQKIGFILQEPFLFTGTIRENIIYGNKNYADYTSEQLMDVMEKANLHTLLERFDEGLDTKVVSSGESVSLGQKQLIAFMRAVLRDPELLVLDEATANIDTVTEQLLEDILKRLPEQTTRVIIAHRLNTIENADEIFFVNDGEIIRAGSFNHAMNMLLQHERST